MNIPIWLLFIILVSGYAVGFYFGSKAARKRVKYLEEIIIELRRSLAISYRGRC